MKRSHSQCNFYGYGSQDCKHKIPGSQYCKHMIPEPGYRIKGMDMTDSSFRGQGKDNVERDGEKKGCHYYQCNFYSDFSASRGQDSQDEGGYSFEGEGTGHGKGGIYSQCNFYGGSLGRGDQDCPADLQRQIADLKSRLAEGRYATGFVPVCPIAPHDHSCTECPPGSPSLPASALMLVPMTPAGPPPGTPRSPAYPPPGTPGTAAPPGQLRPAPPAPAGPSRKP